MPPIHQSVKRLRFAIHTPPRFQMIFLFSRFSDLIMRRTVDSDLFKKFAILFMPSKISAFLLIYHLRFEV